VQLCWWNVTCDSNQCLLTSVVQFFEFNVLISCSRFHFNAHCCAWWRNALCLKHCTVSSKRCIRLKSSAWVWSFETFSLFLHTLVYDPLYMCLFQFTFHYLKILIRAFSSYVCGMLWTVSDTRYGIVCAWLFVFTDISLYCATNQALFVLWYNQIFDSLRAGQSGDRILVGPRFSAPVQTGSGAHPASYTVGTGSFVELNQAGCGVDHPPHRALRLKKEKSYTSTPPLGLCGLL